MSGLNRALSGVAAAGVMLKSARDYQQEVENHDSQQARSKADLTAQNQRNTAGQDQLNELQRQRTGEAEDRDTVRDYYSSAHPDAQPAPAPAPIANATDTPAPQSLPMPGGDTAPAPTDLSAPATDAAPPPTEQPMPASAMPGSTFSASKPVAPPGTTLPAPSPTPAPAPAAAPAPPGGGRAGLLDVLAQKAYARGDATRANALIDQKQALYKEGFAQAAHEALMDPTNTGKIEQVFNANGSIRLVPGSLKYDGKGMYSGTSIQPDGSQRPFQNFDMLHAAMLTGVIAPPQLKSFGADQNVFSIGPDGKPTKVQSAQHTDVKINRNGDWIEWDKDGGTAPIFHRANGADETLTPTQAAAVKEIDSLVGREAKSRNDRMIPGSADNPIAVDQPQVASLAQNIYMNNPDARKAGLNGPLAAKIAMAINDKDPNVVQTMLKRDGQIWNVVQYKSGKTTATYAISPVVSTPVAPAAATAAAAAPSPSAAAPAGKPIPTPAPALPAPPAPAAQASAPAAPKALPRPAPVATRDVPPPDVAEFALVPPNVPSNTQDPKAAAEFSNAIQQQYAGVQAVKKAFSDYGLGGSRQGLSRIPPVLLQYALSSKDLSNTEKAIVLGYLKERK